MSLFGNLGGQQPGTSGVPTSGTPASSNLFGANTNTQSGTGTTSGLFGNLGGGTSQPAQPASTGGLGGGLFGSTLGGSKPASTSAFGTSPSQPPAQAGGFGSLFSKPPATQQSGMGNPQQTGGLGQSSLFGTASTQQAPQQQQQQQQQQQGAPLSQSTTGTGRSAHFDHLLERGRKRNAGENGGASYEELPSLQLGLGDIARKVRNLGAGGPSADQVRDGAQDRAAHYLLSASGVKMGSTLRDLNQFSAQSGIAANGTAQTLLDTDVDGYVSNLHSQSTLSLIQEGLEQSKRDFDSFLEDNVQIEWDKQRQRIYEHFGLGRQSEDMAASQSTFGNTGRGAFGRSTRKGRSMGPKGASVNGASTFGASTGGPPVIGNGQSVLNGREGNGSSVLGSQAGPRDRYERDKQERFMDEVKKLNTARQEENPFSVLHSFSAVEKASGTEYTDHFLNAYRALIEITGEKSALDASAPGSTNPRPRSFLRDYLDDQPSSAVSVRMRKRILDGSRGFLEKKFLEDVDEAIRKHPNEAQVGGVPSRLAKIRGFVRAKLAFKELDKIELYQRIGDTGEEYPWIIVFYLLRAGLTTDAADYVREKRNFFQNTDRNFQAAIAHYAADPDRRLSPDLQQKISHVYAQRVRLQTQTEDDPYRMACYKLIGRCDLSRRSLQNVRESMDDWTWLQFNLARESNRAEENAGELYGLEEIRSSVRDIGQRHFNEDADAAGGYGVYFYLATLAGMFESALGYLYNHNYVSTVHFAIALDYYGLIRVSDWATGGSEVLTYTTRQQPQLNFGRIVGAYTADFRAARADAAADYLILICLNSDLPGDAGRQQTELCHEALRELVLETREFSTLLGDVKGNGETTPGLIQERLSLLRINNDIGLLNTITREAAKMADDNGRTNDAILLCHLAGEYDSVISILSRSLAEALSIELGQEPLRLEPLKPRVADVQVQQQQQQASDSTSISMLGTDDPVELAKRVLALYDANNLWWRQVAQINRETVGILFKLNLAKKTMEARNYAAALEGFQKTDILPLTAAGNLSIIRSSANSFNQYPPEIARNIGNVLLWCIACCSHHREYLLSGAFDDAQTRAIADALLQQTKDLMVFAGLIRYKLPPRVFEMLAREGQDGGVY